MSNNEAKSINWSASRYCVRWGAAPIPGYAQYVVPAENIVVDADVTAPRWGHCPAGGIIRRKGCLPHLREQHQNTIEFSWITLGAFFDSFQDFFSHVSNSSSAIFPASHSSRFSLALSLQA